MEINRTTDYALRVVMHLARHGPRGRVTSARIAAEQGIPPDYVPKVLQALGRAGIVATVPGRFGGVHLSRLPGKLTVLDVVQAMEGPVLLNRCLVRKGECPRDRLCPVHRLWARAQEGLVRTLRAATIAGLLRDGPGRNRIPQAPRTVPGPRLR